MVFTRLYICRSVKFDHTTSDLRPKHICSLNAVLPLYVYSILVCTRCSLGLSWILVTAPVSYGVELTSEVILEVLKNLSSQKVTIKSKIFFRTSIWQFIPAIVYFSKTIDFTWFSPPQTFCDKLSLNSSILLSKSSKFRSVSSHQNMFF